MTHWKECKVEGCDRIAKVRGWCPCHYNRWRYFGDPLADVPVQQGISITQGPRQLGTRGRPRLYFVVPGDKSRIQDGSTETES